MKLCERTKSKSEFSCGFFASILLGRIDDICQECERLLSLDDKSLMVEMILAMRGLYAQIESIEAQQYYLSDKIDSIESDISSLEDDVSYLESKINSVDS